MIVHNLNPVLLQLGPLEIRYYGLVYVLGFLLVAYVLQRYRKKGLISLSKEEVWDLVFYLMVGVVVGARLFEVVVWNPFYYLANPLKIFYVWEGGMAFHGGLLGAIVAGYLYSLRHKSVNFLQLADIISIPAIIALAFGRIANFINGEIIGTLTNLPWCVQFPNADGCRHPVQIYSALKRFAIAGFLSLLFSRPHKEGFIFLNLVLWVGVGRFFLDFLRADARYFGLSIGQYASIFMVVAAAFFILKYYRKSMWKAPGTRTNVVSVSFALK